MKVFWTLIVLLLAAAAAGLFLQGRSSGGSLALQGAQAPSADQAAPLARPRRPQRDARASAGTTPPAAARPAPRDPQASTTEVAIPPSEPASAVPNATRGPEEPSDTGASRAARPAAVDARASADPSSSDPAAALEVTPPPSAGAAHTVPGEPDPSPPPANAGTEAGAETPASAATQNDLPASVTQNDPPATGPDPAAVKTAAPAREPEAGAAAPPEPKLTAEQLAAQLFEAADERERAADPAPPTNRDPAAEPTGEPEPAAAPETTEPTPTSPDQTNPDPNASGASPTEASSPGTSPDASTEPASTAPATGTPAVDPAAPPAGETAEATGVAALGVRQDDGSLLVDDRFVITGAGTKTDPYRVGWEHLVSAAETYEPRKGQTEIPTWVQALHDSHVKLTGYLAFPLATETVDEALIMLNQWDGCCIGIPPSPYDGVEVRLSTPVELKQGQFFQFGSVTGVFKVDPYLVNNWLVGLYLMEDAALEAGM